VNISPLRNPKAFRTKLTAWFRRHGRDLPWRRTRDPYAIMVSEFMLQQTQVATVVPYYERWLARFPDFATLAVAEESEVLSVWQGLGYYSRARNLQRAAREVVTRFGGDLPREPGLIASLPGIGRYTAGAIAAFAFDQPVATIDGNIARVLARLLDLREPIDAKSGSEILWRTAEALQPLRGGRLYTSAIMELGALLCTSRKPQCLLCPVRSHCAADAPEALPLKKARARTVALDEPSAWIYDGQHVLLEQQTGTRWRGLWKLPRLDVAPDGVPLLMLTYPFTNHRVTLRIFSQRQPRQLLSHQSWIAVADLPALALAAPHRRAIERLLATP
jgi:A/G-specific adenine glycosylase